MILPNVTTPAEREPKALPPWWDKVFVWMFRVGLFGTIYGFGWMQVVGWAGIKYDLPFTIDMLITLLVLVPATLYGMALGLRRLTKPQTIVRSTGSAKLNAMVREERLAMGRA